MMDKYFSIKENVTGLYKEKGSKFIAYAFPVTNETDVQGKLQAIKREHHKARHHCYAYVIGLGAQIYRSYDDGEPRHTAGDPILNQIRSSQLKDILIIVVRYYGGTKLGKSGLINAYKSAAKDAISNSVVIQRVIKKAIRVSFPYEAMNDIMHIIREYELEITAQRFDIDCTLTCLAPFSESADIIGVFKRHTGVTEVVELSS
jgi:uncharacterized YigZ family protein